MTSPNPMDLPIATDYPYRLALTTAISLAQQAGALILDVHRRGPRHIVVKGGNPMDVVTEADTAAQALILETIHERFPDHGIVAEESGGDRPGQGGAIWYIDPLDGTTNFASGLPIFAVSLGLWVDGRPEVSVVQDVVRQRTYWAAAGQGAWMDSERRLQVSKTTELSHSVLATGFPRSRAQVADNNLAEFVHLTPLIRDVRRSGSAALDQAWVADGRMDGFWEPGLAAWDCGAGVLLVLEAGGVVSDYQGEAYQPGGKQYVATNGLVHEALLAEIRHARQQAGFA
ncbi:MAG: inositol monophosphatase [Caldilineales bacterium]|nr:inositol monophosphatase [Caldilineales bacterium]